MKRMVCVLLAALMVTSVGCGGGKEEIKPNVPDVGGTVGDVEVPVETPEETVKETEEVSGVLELVAGQDLQGMVSCGDDHIVGLRKDGTVVVAGNCRYGEDNVGDWTDIVKVAADDICTYGLKKDGTIVVTGWLLCEDTIADMLSWTGLVDFAVNEKTAVGLKKDGTVVCSSPITAIKCGDWKDVVQVETTDTTVIALKSDGTVLYTGKNENVFAAETVRSWTDIVDIDIDGDNGVVGLKADGTVVLSSYEADVSSWTDVVSVQLGDWVCGVRSDGTLCTTYQEEIPNATDLVMVAVKDDIVAVKADGTVISNRGTNFATGQCTLWTNIGLPE